MQPMGHLVAPRLLIVDDEAHNVTLLKRIFDHQARVDTAEDGQQALDLLNQNAYDVVLLDIMMPVMTGLELLSIIRQRWNISQLPVILISALIEKGEVTHGIRYGANDYITKPIDVDLVQARVATQIQMKRLVDEREMMISRLRSANEMKARMMQVASHDLKNPLTNLKMLQSVMKRETTHHEKMTKMLNMADMSLDAMINVIDDFLGSNAAQGTEVRVDLQAFDSDIVVKQVLKQYAIAAHNKNITLKAGQIQGRIRADKNRLSQVISNLISNAIKYSPSGTTVTVRSESRDNECWRLLITDEGPGIPENEQRFLFEPFSKTRISTQPTAGEDSTGLGLWIVREMMALQQGSVGMETAVQGGATFWLELPLEPMVAAVI